MFLYFLAVHEAVELSFKLQGKDSGISTEVAAELASVNAYAKLSWAEKTLLRKLLAVLEQSQLYSHRFLSVLNLYDQIAGLSVIAQSEQLFNFIFSRYPEYKEQTLEYQSLQPGIENLAVGIGITLLMKPLLFL